MQGSDKKQNVLFCRKIICSAENDLLGADYSGVIKKENNLQRRRIISPKEQPARDLVSRIIFFDFWSLFTSQNVSRGFFMVHDHMNVQFDAEGVLQLTVDVLDVPDDSHDAADVFEGLTIILKSLTAVFQRGDVQSHVLLTSFNSLSMFWMSTTSAVLRMSFSVDDDLEVADDSLPVVFQRDDVQFDADELLQLTVDVLDALDDLQGDADGPGSVDDGLQGADDGFEAADWSLPT